MYPYKAEVLSSIRAFCLAWLVIITPIVLVTTTMATFTDGSNSNSASY
jgi:hypothetical protein